MTLFIFLTWLGWFGDAMALTGSYFMGCDELDKRHLGWKFFMAADLALIGLPLYLHAWNLAALYASFLVLGIRGRVKARKAYLDGKAIAQIVTAYQAKEKGLDA